METGDKPAPPGPNSSHKHYKALLLQMHHCMNSQCAIQSLLRTGKPWAALPSSPGEVKQRKGVAFLLPFFLPSSQA